MLEPGLPYYNLILPQVAHARGFAEEVMRLPKRDRPWFCVQRRGELLYLPDGHQQESSTHPPAPHPATCPVLPRAHAGRASAQAC